MPKKVKELEGMLLRAGFIRKPAKGSHRKYKHECGESIVISGQPGADAKRFQEKDVMEALRRVAEKGKQ